MAVGLHTGLLVFSGCGDKGLSRCQQQVGPRRTEDRPISPRMTLDSACRQVWTVQALPASSCAVERTLGKSCVECD